MGTMCDNFIIYEDNQNEFKMWQGLVGAHYTPYVDGAGNLSWTNNGGLPNPPTVNVTGKGLTITGIVATTGDLPATANQFDTYLVGTADPYYAYMYYENAWVNIGAVGKGEQGDPGFSPVVTVSPITGGHQISITDAEDTEIFDVMDGEGVPTGGTTGQVLKKSSSTDFDTEWGSVEALPTGGTTGQVLTKRTSANFDVEWADSGGGTVQSVNEVLPDQSGNITLTADDIGTDASNISIQDALDGYVHVGTSAPTDPTTKIWLDTDEPGMSGVSSVNGATGTVVLDADDVGAVGLDLLWTNASPTSSFAAQTITIDLSSYDLVLIEFVANATASVGSALYSCFTGILEVGTFGTIISFILYNGSFFNYFRKATVSTSGVTFEGGYATNNQANDAFAVPLKIYGFKGVTT